MNGAVVVLLASSLLVNGVIDDHIGIDIGIDQPIFLDYAYRNKIDYVLIEPVKHLSPDMRMIVKVSFSKKLNETATVTISTQNDEHISYIQLAILSTNEKQATLIYSYNLQYSRPDYFMNIFRFDLHSEYGDDSVEIDVGEYDSTSQRITSETYSYESPKNIALYRNGSLSYVSERIRAEHCYEDVYLTSFKPFDLNGFNLYHIAPYGYEMLDINPKLAIYSDEVLFPHLGQSILGGKYRVVPLTFVKEDFTGKITFAFKDQLYVHPVSLDMSTTPMEGYVKTNQLYFPASIKEGKKVTFSYTISNFGANSYAFAYEENVYVTKKPLGNCGDSRFCITTSESEPDVDLGEKISH